MKVDGRCHCGQIRYEAQIDEDKRAQAFCANCGTPIYVSDAENPQTYGLRVGTLTQRAALPAKLQIWRHSALPWVFDIRSLRSSERA